MTRAHDPCAMCDRFTTKGYDQEAAAGKGRCTGYDNDGTPPRFVLATDAPMCVLFTRATNQAPRQRFLSKQKSRICA